MSLMRMSHSNTGISPDHYDFSYDIAQFVSYSNISPTYGAIIASLNSATLSKCWRDAKYNPKWNACILEELEVLDKNKTWEHLYHYHLTRRRLDANDSSRWNKIFTASRHDWWSNDTVRRMTSTMMRPLHRWWRWTQWGHSFWWSCMIGESYTNSMWKMIFFS
jgi:hypothetical protein